MDGGDQPDRPDGDARRGRHDGPWSRGGDDRHEGRRGPGGRGPGGRGGPWPRGPFGAGPFGPGGPDGPGDGPWFGPGGPGKRGGERFFARGEMRYVILDLIAAEPRHGYDVIRALEEQFSGLYTPSPGTVYPTLQLLADQGLVRSEPADGRTVFHITDEGRTALAAQAETLRAIRERINARPVFGTMGALGPVIGELRDLGQTVMRAASRGVLSDRDRMDRLTEVVRRARGEIEAILTEPTPPASDSAKTDPADPGDAPDGDVSHRDLI